jgi:hypothetical protein
VAISVAKGNTMSIDGVWGFVYWGESGIGVGAIVVKDGKFHGTDSLVKYRGTITEDPASGQIQIKVEMDIPAGVWLVGGAGAMDVAHKRTQSFELPPRFGQLTPVEIPIRPGKVMGVFNQLPDSSAALADGFEIKSKPSAQRQ